MMAAWIQWLGSQFSPEQYVFWTRIECTAWTLADVLIVFGMLRIADIARAVAGVERHRISYVVLMATLPLAVVIPIEPTGTFVLFLEILVTIPHFLIILYVMARDARLFAAALKKLSASN